MPLILLVEDDRDIRESLAQALELEGYEVLTAENGSIALKHLSDGAGTNRRPCLIILDLSMPVMDGREFLRRQSQGEWSDIPVIISSAHRHSDASLRELGHPHLPKPIDVDSLLRLIESVRQR